MEILFSNEAENVFLAPLAKLAEYPWHAAKKKHGIGFIHL
jgi:hypothetical protein